MEARQSREAERSHTTLRQRDSARGTCSIPRQPCVQPGPSQLVEAAAAAAAVLLHRPLEGAAAGVAVEGVAGELLQWDAWREVAEQALVVLLVGALPAVPRVVEMRRRKLTRLLRAVLLLTSSIVSLWARTAA